MYDVAYAVFNRATKMDEISPSHNIYTERELKMTKHIYPEIGQEARYMRATPEGEIFEGVGIVKAIFLDPRNRLMVGVVDVEDAKTWNVDFVGINYPDDMKERYSAAIAEVTRVSTEGNQLVQETVSNYNDAVEVIYSEILGAPIEFNEPEAKQETEH